MGPKQTPPHSFGTVTSIRGSFPLVVVIKNRHGEFPVTILDRPDRSAVSVKLGDTLRVTRFGGVDILVKKLSNTGWKIIADRRSSFRFCLVFCEHPAIAPVFWGGPGDTLDHGDLEESLPWQGRRSMLGVYGERYWFMYLHPDGESWIMCEVDPRLKFLT